jgi:pyridoxamine 5'-phosphate oxidase
MQRNLEDLRRDYLAGTLDIADVDPHPIQQFGRWFSQWEHFQTPDITAVTLATASPEGKPSVRVVLLKGFDAKGFVFYTNYESAKGRAIEENPMVSLLFYWPDLERQVRVEGLASKVTAEESDQYFATRPRGSQVGAWASPQSERLETRRQLEDRFATAEQRFEGVDPIPRPPHWGGFRVIPETMEFWQGRASRLHDRLLYTKRGQEWIIQRLAP